MVPLLEEIEKECIYRGITYEKVYEDQLASMLIKIASPNNNFDIIKVEKSPKIAV